MKRTKFLALALVVAIALMGAGYAYWTDTLTINNTVSTGEFKVEFIEQGWPNHYPRIFGDTGEQYIVKSADHVDAITTSIVIDNIYPGKGIRYELKMQNNGTIPAVFDNAEVNFDDNVTTPDMKNKMRAQFGHYVKNEDGSGTNIGGITGYFSLGQLEAKLNERLNGVRLEPGQFLTFDIPEWLYEEMKLIDPNFNPEDPQCISFKFPKTIVNEDNLENAKAKFDIVIKWKQHNDPNTN